jgi:hypothetical protein
MRIDRVAAKAVLVLSVLLWSAQEARADDGAKLLSFETMAGVNTPFIGATNAIRGVPGGGLPWVLREAKGTLRSDGRIEVEVRGLVLADDPRVPAARRLTNPIASFRVLVSCVSVDAGGAVVNASVITGNFPATTTGDADIEAAVELPAPCLAPVLFVTSPGGAWFAATGG